MSIERIIDTGLHEEDSAERAIEITLRPTSFDEYIGQSRLKANLRLAIEAAHKRNESLDHVLLYGPPGLGKTTMAGIIAHEMGANLRVTSGPAIEKAGDLASILTNLSEGDILFIDEIHRLRRAVEEILYSAMEDYKLDIVIGKGPAARSGHVPFVLICQNLLLLAPPRALAHWLPRCAIVLVTSTVWNITKTLRFKKLLSAPLIFFTLK